MKKLFIALTFALIAASATAMAYTQKDTSLTACTADKVKAVSHVVFTEDTTPKVEAEIRAAFTKVGAGLSFEDFSSQTGFHAFADALTSEDKEAFLAIYQPTNEGSCK